jgi:hypothetical protein
MERFTYKDTKKMTPRSGVKFATTYYIQDAKERARQADWIGKQIKTVYTALQEDVVAMEAAHKPLKGFPKTKGQKNRSLIELLEDMAGEVTGTKKDGTPKDFALAPIERWNKFFQGSDKEFVMVPAGADKEKLWKNLFK